MNLNQIIEQQEKDREELAKLPSGKNKPISWCSEHDCQMGTCFALHYPESSISTAQENTEEFYEHLQEKIAKESDSRMWSERKEQQDKWIELWKHSRK